jgi:hypothetical protein
MIYHPQGENSTYWCERLLDASLTLERLLSDQKKANHRKWRRELHRELNRVRAEREFQSPDWSLGNILSWIAFCDPALICQFKGRFSPSLQGIRSNRPMRVDRPVQELFARLQAGRLKAIRNGAPLPSLYWFGKEVRDLTGDLRFLHTEAIECWPARRDEATTAASPSGADPQNAEKIVAPEPTEPRTARDKPGQAQAGRQGRRGPKPGELNRYREADRALLPDLQAIMRRDQLSASAAARKIEDRISGHGALESRVKRLVALYHSAKKESP